MRRILVSLVAGTAAIGAAPSVWAHAFLDHASPAVGSSVPASPRVVTLWFTQDLEPAFSGVTVTNEAGQRVDLGKTQFPQGSPDELQIGLQPLTPGTYLELARRLGRYPSDRRHFHLRDQAVSVGTGFQVVAEC
jgi:hypothetical protein